MKRTFASFLLSVLFIPFVLSADGTPQRLIDQLDAPLLFLKRHPYMADHIYDDYYTWKPGGGIYVLENPAAPPEEHQIRAIIDPNTPETLGVGVYRDPELSWDAKRLLFAFKGAEHGDTSIYEIGIDGTGLRRLTTPDADCKEMPMPTRAIGKGRHDISPHYLPDGRIVFTSTRQGGRVPCFNSEVDTLHIMNADGTGIHTISVNNVNEFDPAVMHDGRILFGRWEYVDKTALYMQSLWTCNPDGSNETALFANNLAKPTAILQARPVPDSSLIVAALTPHNGQSVGAIAMIDPHRGKNNLEAIFNFTPEHPTEMDQGLMKGPSDPWALSENVVLFANNAKEPHGVIQIIDRNNQRELVLADPEISLYSPMLVKPRPVPPVISPVVEPGKPGRFFVQDVYNGLTGVDRGTVAKLRVLEETTRISGIPSGGRWWNQAFLVSWQGAYTIKNFLGTVPVHEDGSAYFEAPPGRALYFQALDKEGRMLQSMRTFVQAIPGVTRSCVGCHETKEEAPAAKPANTLSMLKNQDALFPVEQRQSSATLERSAGRTNPHNSSEHHFVSTKLSEASNADAASAPRSSALHYPAATIQSESWGSGFVDYPTMIQPILDRHCVSCHGGEKDIAAGIDLSGGWTWAFNISYETLLKNTLSGFLNCVNEAVKTAEILPPLTHGSGAAPLTKLLFDGHGERIPKLTREERELLLAWMDGNSNYYGTWNWSEQATCNMILSAGAALGGKMRQFGCVQCHSSEVGNDWINLQRPELSRILRAPLAKGEEGFGLEWCRDRPAPKPLPLVTQSAQPPDVFKPKQTPAPDPSGQPVAPFHSIGNPHYQEMLAIIRQARAYALAEPRVDMPGAEIQPGVCRQLVPLPVPDRAFELLAYVEADGSVALVWEESAATIGLKFEIHRGPKAGFTDMTLLGSTTLSTFTDLHPPAGRQYYTMIALSENDQRSAPAQTSIQVPAPRPPQAPIALSASPKPGEIVLEWETAEQPWSRFNIYRAPEGSDAFEKLNAEPGTLRAFVDFKAPQEATSRYFVRAVNRRGLESEPSELIEAAPLPDREGPLLFVSGTPEVTVIGPDREPREPNPHGKAKVESGMFDLTAGGHFLLPALSPKDHTTRFSVECWVYFEKKEKMPVLLSSGKIRDKGWFLQQFGAGWRWNIGGVNCDGGEAGPEKWFHLVATFDGERARLFENGIEIASKECRPLTSVWPEPIFVGQYAPSQRPDFQVPGKIAGVKIYDRALRAEEAAAHFEQGAPGQSSL
jgi:hypothetical protein